MTSAIEGPRLIRPGEFREAMALTERCFGFERGGLERRMPHCFDQTRPNRHAVVTFDGDVVSHVACVPAELRAGAATVECHGIAGVATDPDHRGNGYMTQLLEFWLDRLELQDVPLAELEGDRLGYGRFGWENAGREERYRITRRSFTTDPAGSADVRQYRSRTDLELIREIHDRERYRITRTDRRYERLLAQRDLETLVFDGDRPAYLAYRGTDPASVLEFGGSREGVTTLFGSVLETAAELEVFTHPHHPFVPSFCDLAIDWETRPHRKLNILDLPATLEAYEPLLAERWATVDDDFGCPSGAVTLAVEGLETTDAVTVAYDATGVHVEQTRREPDVVLDRRAMTRLLFGSPDACWPIRRSRPFLRAVLPLEYYFWQTETI
ncbi:GNAT family N-acetyltransferase [Saliphagus sp. GCM10025334]